MVQTSDHVSEFGRAKGWLIRPRAILVEGTSDVDLLVHAARKYRARTGEELLGEKLAVLEAGAKDEGGALGVARELITLRNVAQYVLTKKGRPKYRFIALVDNDNAGRRAVKAAREMDRSIVEYRDVFRLHAIMPAGGNREPTALRDRFRKANKNWAGLTWELEDAVGRPFTDDFVRRYPECVQSTTEQGGQLHRNFTRDGKARFHRFIREHAVYADLDGVVTLLQALRFYLGFQDGIGLPSGSTC